jgi:plasmid stabilization system protein ParE
VTVQWTELALSDPSRLYDFLAIRNRDAAARTVQALVDAPARLTQNPRIGERLAQFEPREVRRVLVGDYEVRYEIGESRIFVLRLWHSREDRN